MDNNARFTLLIILICIFGLTCLNMRSLGRLEQRIGQIELNGVK